jgi:hypothetical protein
MRVDVEYHNRSDTSNIKSEQNHLKFIQKLSEQQNWKSRNQGTTKNSHTGTVDIIRKILNNSTKPLSMETT